MMLQVAIFTFRSWMWPSSTTASTTSQHASWATSCGTKGRLSETSLVTLDLLRNLATVASVTLHMNFKSPFLDVDNRHIVHRSDLRYLARFTDVFGASSVILLVHTDPTNIGEALDRLWRKLSRQIPLYIFPLYLLAPMAQVPFVSCGLSSKPIDSASLREILLIGGSYQDSQEWFVPQELRIHFLLSLCQVIGAYFGNLACNAATLALFAHCLKTPKDSEAFKWLFLCRKVPSPHGSTSVHLMPAPSLLGMDTAPSTMCQSADYNSALNWLAPMFTLWLP